MHKTQMRKCPTKTRQGGPEIQILGTLHKGAVSQLPVVRVYSKCNVMCALAWIRCNNSVGADSLGLGEGR